MQQLFSGNSPIPEPITLVIHKKIVPENDKTRNNTKSQNYLNMGQWPSG